MVGGLGNVWKSVVRALDGGEPHVIGGHEPTMLAVPCSQAFGVSRKYHLYFCPSCVKHKEASFLGLYKAKSVRALGHVKKVVTFKSIDLDGQLFDVVDGSEQPDKQERQRILAAAREACRDPNMKRFFITEDVAYYLCNEMVDTDFPKISRGGMRSFRYFDLCEELGLKVLPDSVEEIARLLKSLDWE